MIMSKFAKALLTSVLLLLSFVAVEAQNPSPSPALPATAIPSRLITDPSVRAGWQRYGFGENPTFSVILPTAPASTAENAGASLVNTYTSANDTAVYAAARVDRIPVNLETASEEVRARYFTQFFNGFATGFQKGMSTTTPLKLELLDVTKVTAAGREGFQQRLVVGPMEGRAQMVFSGNTALCIVAMWLPTAPAADYESFFSSFRVMK